MYFVDLFLIVPFIILHKLSGAFLNSCVLSSYPHKTTTKESSQFLAHRKNWNNLVGVILCVTSLSGKVIRCIFLLNPIVTILLAMTTSLEQDVLKENCSRFFLSSKVTSARFNDPFGNIPKTTFFFVTNLLERGNAGDNAYQMLLCAKHCAICREE